MNSSLDLRAVAEKYITANTTSNLYLLLDHAGMPGLHRKLIGGSAQWVSLFRDTREDNALRVAPILVLIGGSGRYRILRSLLEWIGEHGTYTSSVIMLASDLPIDAMKNRLAARLEVKLSENMDAMLRYFDTRIFEQLINVLSVEQARVFFSPAENWWYVDRAAEFRCIHTEFNANAESEAPLELSAAQESQLLDASEPDQVLALLRENAPGLISTLPFFNKYEFVVRHIRAARSMGLRSTIDFAIYSSVAFSRGEDFAKSPVWSQLLNEVKLNRLTMAQAVSENDMVT